MFGVGTSELIIILVIVLVVFGAGKLPKVMKDLGRGVKSFKDAMSEREGTGDVLPEGVIEGQEKKKDA